VNAVNTKTKWWLMAVSIALGSLSAWAIDRHLQAKTQEIESRTRMDEMTLLVAARDLPSDTVLEEADIATESYPVKWAPDQALEVEQLDRLLGKRLLTEVRAGQPLMQIHTLDIEAPGISARLGLDRKAVTIALEGGSGGVNLIREGDHVDLFVSFEHQGKRITAPLLQSVEVLASGSHGKIFGRPATEQIAAESGITVSISRNDTVKLISAREAGSISAVLSSTDRPSSGQSQETAPGDLAALLGLKTDAPTQNIPILYGDRLSPELEEGDSTALSVQSLDTKPSMSSTRALK